MEATTSVTLVCITLNENHTVELSVLVGHFVYKNPVKQPSSPGVLVSQWLEHQTNVM